MIATTVRCFRTPGKGERGYGVWLMTRPDEPESYRGMFVHGRRDEICAPYWRLKDLANAEAGIAVEISPEEALVILHRWPEAMAEAAKCFARHPANQEAKS